MTWRSLALQFAEMHGARSIVTSSSDDKLEHVREFGAQETINYEEAPNWNETVLDLTNGGGVDHGIEVGGPGTLERSLDAASVNGHVHLIGVLTGQQGQIDPSPVLGKAIELEGVFGVGGRAMFDRMNRAIDNTSLEPVIDRVFDFEAVHDAYQYLESGAHQGKVVVSIP